MINLLIMLIISCSSAIGISIALVEKGNEWPIRKYKLFLKRILRKIHWKAPRVLNCSVCFCFWATLLVDIFLFYGSGWYFLWPFSGFISLRILHIIYKAIDSNEQPIIINNNNYITSFDPTATEPTQEENKE